MLRPLLLMLRPLNIGKLYLRTLSDSIDSTLFVTLFDSICTKQLFLCQIRAVYEVRGAKERILWRATGTDGSLR